MPMDPNRRRDYMTRAGLTDAVIAQMVGTITVQPENVRLRIASDMEIAQVRQGMQAFLEEAAVISAMYNTVAKQSRTDGA
jgi:hypothetical protein